MIVAVLMGTAIPLVHPRVTHATGAGAIQGTLFFDANADGIRNAGEAGLPAGATIELYVLDNGSQVFLRSTTTIADGTYQFDGLDQNVYVVTEVNTPSLGYTRTTPNTRQVTVGTTPITGVDFGVTLLITISGVVFDDVNQNGIRNLGEPPIPNTQVDVFEDLNANGLIDGNESRVGSGVSNSQGVYVVAPSLLPGVYVVRFQPPAGVGSPTQVPAPLVGQDGVSVLRLDFGAVVVHGGAASVTGKIWKDVDGDEIIETDEGALPNVAVALILDSNRNGQIDPGESVAAQGVSDSQGVYSLGGLTAGDYVLRVDDLTIPAGWIPSFDPTLLAFTLAPGQARTNLDLGFYDPLVTAPMRASDWKNEIRRSGRPRYSVAEVNAFIATAQTASGVFPEIVPLVDALLRPTQGDEGQARKEYAALALNVASGRLLARTPIHLPTLTTATTIGGAVAEIEGLLVPPSSQLNTTYRRVKTLAETLNKGEGVGYGLTNVSAVARATYRGADVTSALRRGGDVVDLMMNGPIYLTRWSPGNLDPTINVFRPRVRIRVNAFYNGGVLDAFQKLPNGDLVSLGTIVPPFWNKDVKTDYTFDLWRVNNLSDLVSTEIRLVTRDSDAGTAAHIKIDAAEIVFDY
jgi:hypothetical protein